ncbi:hypothetical protein B9Z65_1288 [Elsinoe australis]|uniref:Malic acid transport protein n=1 Tax=Elsinoe australis TaxID=40998 RepID=A0A2P7YQ50_9PEZI|nr:hypothetical protein B9Z65_1288 [Elsinoe australis]
MANANHSDMAEHNGQLENGHSHPTEKPVEDVKTKYTWGTWIIERFNWSYFTCTQSTGGIAIALSECPKQFDGLQTIGLIVFIFNIVLFLFFTSLMITRWTLKPSKFKECFTSPPECYFYPPFWLTVATIIICMQRYGVSHAGPWLIVAIRVCFWIYAAVVFLSSVIHIVVLCKHTPVQAIQMNPAWFLLIFYVMLVGTVAGSIAMSQPPHHRIPIIVAGVAYQGVGWIVSLLFFPWYMAVLFEKGWPDPSQRPGLFMPIGSVGYTIIALIGCARAAPAGYGYFADPVATQVVVIMATWASIFMWLFALWIFGLAFCISVAEIVVRKEGRWTMPMSFKNSWWAMIFPNVGFAIGTAFIGQELQSNAIAWVATSMIILLVTFWLFDLALMCKTIYISLFRDSRIKLS